MKNNKIVLITGGNSDAKVIAQIKHQFKESGYEIKQTHHRTIINVSKRLWAAISGKPISTTLHNISRDDIVIGHGEGCKHLMSELSQRLTPIKIVLIEPDLPTDITFPVCVEHATLFFNLKKRGTCMGSVGYHPKDNALPVAMHAYEVSTRDLRHYPTWLWRTILRTRLIVYGVLRDGA